MMSQTRVQVSVALSMQTSFSCSFAYSHVLFSWKVKGLTRLAPVANGFGFSMASVNADIANSLVLSAASSSPELWLLVSDLHPRVQSAVKAFAFGRGGVAAGVDVTVARFKAAIRLASLGVEKIKQKFKSFHDVIDCVVCPHWNLCAHCCESRICCWRFVHYQHHRVQLYGTLINHFLFLGHPIQSQNTIYHFFRKCFPFWPRTCKHNLLAVSAMWRKML